MMNEQREIVSGWPAFFLVILPWLVGVIVIVKAVVGALI